MKTLKNITILAALGLFAQSAFAELTADQAASLGGDKLTPIGAERAANAAGTIPAWTGGLTKLPAGYVAGEALVDPFPNEKPLFTITAQNFEQYKDNLSAGQIALLKRYPGHIPDAGVQNAPHGCLPGRNLRGHKERCESRLRRPTAVMDS